MPFGIPNPVAGSLGGAASALPGVAGDVSKEALGGVAGWLESGIASAAGSAFSELEKLVNNSAGSLSFYGSSWWAAKVAGPGGLWATMVVIAATVMLGGVVLAVIGGAVSGDPMAALRAVMFEVPRSVFGIATVVALTSALAGVVDWASAAVLPSVAPNFGRWFAASTPLGFFSSFIELLALAGAVLTWVELVIRDGLVFFLVALSPVVLAVRVWPPAAGAWRRFVELVVALIAAKFVIALALALGAAALSASSPSGKWSAAGQGSGAALLLLAAFSPFVLLRMIPHVEAAAAAHGISRAPLRAAQAGMGTAATALVGAAALSRLAQPSAASMGSPGEAGSGRRRAVRGWRRLRRSGRRSGSGPDRCCRWWRPPRTTRPKVCRPGPKPDAPGDGPGPGGEGAG